MPSNKGSKTIKEVDTLTKGEKVSPALEREMNSYVTTLMHVIHSEETRGSVMEMLQSTPDAETAIPATAVKVNQMVEGSMQGKGKPPKDSVKMAGAFYIVSDLAELGNAAGLFQVTEEQVSNLFGLTVQEYIRLGLADGSIDPIQLQADTEPLLNDKQREVGSLIQNELGMPTEPTAQMGVDSVVRGKTRPLEQKNQELKTALAGQKQVQQAPQEEV